MHDWDAADKGIDDAGRSGKSSGETAPSVALSSFRRRSPVPPWR